MSDKKDEVTPSLATFMKKKHSEGKSPKKENKAKKSLREAREEKKEQEKKELDEAKKESIFKSSKYNQSKAMNKRMKSFSILYPLAIGGAILAFIGIMKSGPVFSKIISSLIKMLLGKGL